MQRAFLSFFLLLTTLGGLNVARATALGAGATVQDTIVVRLPNKATLTLTVRNAAQLREMKNYHLDSLTSRLATYINQAEAAAKTGTADQVTMRFYPDKDQPGQNLPEEIRITAHKPGANEKGRTKTQVFLNKKFGLVAYTDEDGNTSYNFNSEKKKKSAADSLKRVKREYSSSVSFRLAAGLNTFVNTTANAVSPSAPGLDYWGFGVGYVDFGLDFIQPLAYSKRAKLALTFGPEFSMNNFRLQGNNQWSQGSATTFERAPDTKQIDKSTLYMGTLNLPVMLRLKLRNKEDRRTLSAGIGGFGGYRVGSNIETEYKLAGSDYKHNDKVSGPLNLNDWQYGVQGEIGFHALRLFAKYNMNELFRDGKGPNTHVLSFGLNLIGF
jgi:Outer membrane protein beta-barrel domain